MAGVQLTASRDSRAAEPLFASSGTRHGLLLAAAMGGLLAGPGAANAQDLANTTPFVANAPRIGDVLSNTSTIDNNAAAPGWQGDIVSNSNFINNNFGATWTGNIESNSETINNFAGASWFGSVSTAGDLKNYGTWTGDVLANSVKIENHVGALWTGDVYGNSHKLLNYGSWVGDLVTQGATGELNSYGTWLGDVQGNAGTIYNDGVWTGDIQTNSYRIISNLLDTSATDTLWQGDVLTNDGTVMNYINSTWRGNVVDNAGTVANYNAWYGNLNNRGRVYNEGVWTGKVVNSGAVFWAQNQFVGDFDNSGSVQLIGNLAISGLLNNSGHLQLTKTAGAQTLTVGNLTLGSTSSYEIDVTAIGTTDRMLVTGAAKLGGSVMVKTSTTDGGTFDEQKTYTILTGGSLDGTFDAVTTDLAFLSPHLSYDAHNVYLGLRRNDVGFAGTGASGNQIGVGAAVEALDPTNPLYDAVLWLTPDEARNAFDQLSGEAFAASANHAIQTAGRFGAMALSHLDGARGETRVWAEAYGAGAKSEGRVAALDTQTGGLVLGADGVLGNWRLGALLQLGTTEGSASALQTRISSTDYGAGLYAATSWGALDVALGGTYTLHDSASQRVVDFPGFADRLEGEFEADTSQAFAELSHRFDFGGVALRPYAGLAQVRYSSAGFVEVGGPAALTRTKSVIDASFTTLGLGVEHGIVVDADMTLTAHTSLGWRHGFGATPTSIAALEGAPGFTITSDPIADDVMVLSAGLTLDMNDANALELSYDGQAGDGSQSHALRGTWARSF